MYRLLPVVAVILLIAGCAGPAPCSVQAKAFIDLMEQEERAWTSAEFGAGGVFTLDIVNPTAARDLAPSHIADMQEIRDRVANAAAPQCAQAARAAQVQYMDMVIRSFQDYADGKTLHEIEPGLDSAEKQLGVATQKLGELKAN